MACQIGNIDGHGHDQRLGKPVITSNQATIWNTLRMAGVNDRIEGYGQLLSKY